MVIVAGLSLWDRCYLTTHFQATYPRRCLENIRHSITFSSLISLPSQPSNTYDNTGIIYVSLTCYMCR
ncbi:hypothetical protein NP493_1374g00078 [Ridgeia piscesae]|uniref:Uncharacterized protein n=1 Tax=Ridgeia piscesae TaxID=27915 RepID=A0AAD9K771_RIDPI|nr:hypothetical protein NP493_1374g00078 [Ridgeia piscesae]